MYARAARAVLALYFLAFTFLDIVWGNTQVQLARYPVINVLRSKYINEILRPQLWRNSRMRARRNNNSASNLGAAELCA